MDKQYQIYQGDCLEVMDKLIEQGVKVDAIITDPPFGTTTCKWDSVIPFDMMWERLSKLVKDNGAIVFFGAMPFTAALVNSNLKGYKHHWIWKKNRGTGFQVAKYRPMMATEDIIAFTVDGKRVNYYPIMEKRIKPVRYSYSGKTNHNLGTDVSGKKQQYISDSKYPLNVIECPKPSKPIHPTQKPVELLEYLIKTYTNEGETVLDFTAGSGSTGVACINTNRKFIGIELDKSYFEIMETRLKEAVERNKEE